MIQLRQTILLAGIFSFSIYSNAQVLTQEDSLNAGLIASEKSTVISGYGEAKYQNDLRYHTAKANVTRAVIFLGHKFNKNISFFSELEVEDAKVSGGEEGGEVAFEQLFLKFNFNKDIYLSAGLFIPRIGIINENHLPTTFNGNDRPFVETFLVPATWRELGICLYGKSNKLAGLNYSLGLVNGLSSANFEYGKGIRGGRFEGREATASNIAVTGSLLYYLKNFRMQVSGYYGGSAGLSKREADSLQLNYGSFGTPVMLTEADIQYNNKGFSFRALGAMIQIPDAEKINRAYGNNTANTMIGGYGEIGYNLLKLFNKGTQRNFTLFTRYEYMDLNNKIPANGITNDLLVKSFLVSGLSYQPIKGVIVKADYVFRTTGEPNPALIVNPFPQAQPYYTTNGFFNLGIGYSF
jgi:hypothetical protein